jgi:hypothetical protein
MKALLVAEETSTREGKKRVTHEVYNYMIKPYASPPIVVEIVKGNIINGKFKPIVESAAKFQISFEEFKLLISPNDKGKPAGDFRLSDIVALLRKRNATPILPDSLAISLEEKVKAIAENEAQLPATVEPDNSQSIE